MCHRLGFCYWEVVANSLTLSTHCGPGSGASASRALSQSLQQACLVLCLPFPQLGNPPVREVKKLAQGLVI